MWARRVSAYVALNAFEFERLPAMVGGFVLTFGVRGLASWRLAQSRLRRRNSAHGGRILGHALIVRAFSASTANLCPTQRPLDRSVCCFAQLAKRRVGYIPSSALTPSVLVNTRPVPFSDSRPSPQCPTSARSRRRTDQHWPLQPIGAVCAATSCTWCVATSVLPASAPR
jgi:hypothetical protein